MRPAPVASPTVVAGLVAATIAAPARAQDPASHVERLRLGVVEITTEGKDLAGNPVEPLLGSGFVVHSDSNLKKTFIFTAKHVVGKADDWLEAGGDLKRTIRIRRQAINREMVDVTSNVTVPANITVIEDPDRDVAILSIPEQSIAPLPAAGVTHLSEGTSAALMGFPAASRKTAMPFAVRISYVQSLEFANHRFQFEKSAYEGQSGGPLIDGMGRVVGVASENNDRTRPRYLHVVLASVGVDLLNGHLQKLGRPLLAYAPDGPTPKVVVTNRTGSVTVQIRGTGGGDLASGNTAEQKLNEPQEARLRGLGGETSQCDEDAGRIRSEASAAASLQVFERTGLRMGFELSAQGGRFRTGATCLAKRLVGFSGRETTAIATADAVGEITFRAAAAPFILRLAWQGMPENANIEMTSPDGTARHYLVGGTGDEGVNIPTDGTWRINVKARVEAKQTGGHVSEKVARNSVLFLEAR